MTEKNTTAVAAFNRVERFTPCRHFSDETISPDKSIRFKVCTEWLSNPIGRYEIPSLPVFHNRKCQIPLTILNLFPDLLVRVKYNPRPDR